MQSPSRQDFWKNKNPSVTNVTYTDKLFKKQKIKKRLDSKLRYIMDVVELRKEVHSRCYTITVGTL